jgi:16S rRNA processing protein RimM
VKLEQDEYFIADLEGLLVNDEQGHTLGVLSRVLQSAANDCYVIKRPDGSEFLLPAIKQCVLEVRPTEGWIKVHVLEGLE